MPSSATIAGTIRAFDDVDATGPNQGRSLREVVTQTLDGLTSAYGATYEMNLRKGSPPTRNDTALESALLPALNTRWPGTLRVTTERGMFAEDFSYYTAEFPCLYFGLGVTAPGQAAAGVHTAEFAIDPAAFAIGARWLVEVALTASTTLAHASR